jgi:glycosyltransferase involved in cell wall biosynthesis
MKIAIFTDAYWPRINGVTVSVDSFSHALVKAGQKVLIVCPLYPKTDNNSVLDKKDSAAENEPQIIKIPSVPVFVSKEDRLGKFGKWFWVFKQVENFDPDIIHINTEMVIAEFGFLYAKIHNLPVIYTFHTMWEDYTPHYFPMFPSSMVKYVTRRVLENVIKRSYRVIVPTSQIELTVRDYEPNTQTFLLPTGIDPKIFEHDKEESAAFRERLEELFPQLKGKRILLFAGRVVKEKNIGFLLNILPEILAKHPDVILLIAGNGPDQGFILEEAKKKGIEDNCVFTGYFDRNDLALVYAISEVFVFPSLTDTQGLVTLEAMLSGTPVVAIGALGTLTVMGGDNGGFMVKDDPVEFTGRVLELLDNPELRLSKSQEAKKHARSWSIEELTKKLINIYKSTTAAYTEEYGDHVTPIWELIRIKSRWIKNNMVIRKAYRKK